MNILVTGGAGFIGSNVVALLLKRDHVVTVLDNFSTGHLDNLSGLNIRLIRGSVCDEQPLNQAMEGQDGVAHLAASVGNKKSIEEPLFDATTNVLGTLHVLESMRKHRVHRIVYSSSAGIFGEPQYEPVDEKHPCEPVSPYGATKLCAEKQCLAYMRMYGIRAVCLRYFNVYGIHQRFDAYGNVIPIFVTKLLAGSPLTIYGDGEQTRDFISVRDVAMVNAQVLENEETRGVYNVGTGARISINVLVKILLIIHGCETDVHYVSERLGDVRHCTADIRKLQTALGFVPSVDRVANLKEYYLWMLNNRG